MFSTYILIFIYKYIIYILKTPIKTIKTTKFGYCALGKLLGEVLLLGKKIKYCNKLHKKYKYE